MSIPSLMSALAQGFNAQQIVTWLMNSHKKIAKNIKSAKSQGYNDDDIVSYLTKGKHASHGQRNQMLSGQTEQEKGARIFNQGTDWSKVRKGIGTAASVIGGAYGLARGIPAIANTISGALNPASSPNAGPTPIGGAPISPNPSPQPQGPNAQAPQVQQSAQQNQPQPPNVTPSPAPSNSISIIQQMGLVPQIQTLAQAGNTPEAIAAAVGVSLRPEQRKWLDGQIKAGTAKSLPDMISEVLSQPMPGENTPQNQPNAEQITPEKQTNFKKQEKNSPETGDLVSTPEGNIGHLKSMRNGQALVDENGKLHQVKATDLESLTNKYKDVHIDVSTIPESERSAPLYGISANRDNTAVTIEYFPRDENSVEEEYEYFRKDGQPFDEDLLNRLKEGVDIPVTSGVEWAGFWNADKGDSRGSANHKEMVMKAQDIEKVQSGQEKDNPDKPLFFKKKTKLFTHGYHRKAKQQFAQHAKGFKSEYKEMTGGKRKKRSS